MIKRLSILSVLMSAVLLSGCEGYEMVRVDAFPYGNERTAGTGVAYVLKKMAPPAQELKLKKMVPPPPEVIEPVPAYTPVMESRVVKPSEPVQSKPDFQAVEKAFENLFKEQQKK